MVDAVERTLSSSTSNPTTLHHLQIDKENLYFFISMPILMLPSKKNKICLFEETITKNLFSNIIPILSWERRLSKETKINSGGRHFIIKYSTEDEYFKFFN